MSGGAHLGASARPHRVVWSRLRVAVGERRVCGLDKVANRSPVDEGSEGQVRRPQVVRPRDDGHAA
eukprot:6967268-Prymnesium_polylepis.2